MNVDVRVQLGRWVSCWIIFVDFGCWRCALPLSVGINVRWRYDVVAVDTTCSLRASLIMKLALLLLYPTWRFSGISPECYAWCWLALLLLRNLLGREFRVLTDLWCNITSLLESDWLIAYDRELDFVLLQLENFRWMVVFFFVSILACTGNDVWKCWFDVVQNGYFLCFWILEFFDIMVRYWRLCSLV